jgi:hypothetical protein
VINNYPKLNKKQTMKKIIYLSLLTLIILGCGKSDSPTVTPVVKEPTVAEKIRKAWAANQVTEGGTVVYTKTGTSNIKPTYSKFKLDLSSVSAVTLTEFDGNTFTGTWEVINDKTLTLKNLNPQPSGTTGTVEYSITEASTTALKLTRTTVSAKTGGSSLAYVLE